MNCVERRLERVIRAGVAAGLVAGCVNETLALLPVTRRSVRDGIGAVVVERAALRCIRSPMRNAARERYRA